MDIQNYLRDQDGSRSLVFDQSVTHESNEGFGSCGHPQQNGLLTLPQDLDAPLRLAAQRKINNYRQQYADKQNISFLPAIVSTSTESSKTSNSPSFPSPPFSPSCLSLQQDAATPEFESSKKNFKPLKRVFKNNYIATRT